METIIFIGLTITAWECGKWLSRKSKIDALDVGVGFGVLTLILALIR